MTEYYTKLLQIYADSDRVLIMLAGVALLLILADKLSQKITPLIGFDISGIVEVLILITIIISFTVRL